MKLTKSKLQKIIQEELQIELFGFSAFEKAIKKVKNEIHPNAFMANISRTIHGVLKPHIKSSADAEDAISRLGKLPFGYEEIEKIIRDLVSVGRL